MSNVKDIAILREQIIANATVLFLKVITKYRAAVISSPLGHLADAHPFEIIIKDDDRSDRNYKAYLINKYYVGDGRVTPWHTALAAGAPDYDKFEALKWLFKATALALGKTIKDVPPTSAVQFGCGEVEGGWLAHW